MSSEKPVLTRKHLFAAAFFALFLYMLYQAGHVIAPFLTPLLWAGIITLALLPLYRRVLALVKGRATLAAAIMTAITLLLVVGPAVTLIIMLATQAIDVYHYIAEAVRSGALADAWERILQSRLGSMIAEMTAAGPDLKERVLQGLSDLSAGVASQFGALLKNTLSMAMNVLIMVIAVFFFFRDGEGYYRTALELLPFTAEQKETVAQKTYDTFRAVINGVFLIALFQGAMTGVGMAVFGFSFAVFWAFVATVLALLPVAGAALVWVPAAGYLYLNGAGVKAILLVVWGAVFVSLPDNFIKPLLIGKRANIPIFLLFLSILGGLQVYGFLGILFGPLIVTLLTALVKIYREEFAEKS
jgi:predicted PurR-regulated permease PerM